MPQKSVTMTDVARHAGVSISAVSRVINGSWVRKRRSPRTGHGRHPQAGL
ncbi:MAG: LacI family DNA-binding transcriptional regulator [Chloroflexi bacterium]|nr:LacI family DNA-binding transcriptional regulator [Chloroflexota bacterium]